MPDAPLIFPKRMIHLDFHTGPDIPDVGVDFDPECFAQTFADSHVDSVTLFAKCHHGHLYYNTERAERHPGLKDNFDLLNAQIEALHRKNIRAPIYLSVQCDEYAANTHPEWIALDEDLKQVKWGNSALKAGWQILDMSSPYQDFLADQLDEVLRKFAPTDGIFLDMCWDQPSYSKWTFDGMRKVNLDPASAEDRAIYARQIAHQYMERFRNMVEQTHKNHPPTGIWFNSRPKANLHEEKKYLRHIEVESLPTGGWGYAYFPYVSRLVRPLNMPTLSHTGRFFRSWGDHASLKPEMALKYECAQILSQNMTSGVGDLLHPRGKLNKPAYDLIGKVYKHIKACEPFVEGGHLLSDIGVIVDSSLGDNPGACGVGMVRLLQQSQQQFDLLPSDGNDDLSKYRVVIVPENIIADSGLQKRIKQYHDNGGAVIVCGKAALGEDGKPWLDSKSVLVKEEQPIDYLFLHPDKAVQQNLPEHGQVMPETAFRLQEQNSGKSLVKLGEPYFHRRYDHFSGHEYTPENKISNDSAVVLGNRVITFSFPIFTAYANHPTPYFRKLFNNCLAKLLPTPLLITDGPNRLETTVVRSGETVAVHLMSFDCERRSENLDVVEDAIPLVDMNLKVRLDKKTNRATLQPHNKELSLEYKNGYAHTKVTLLDGHGIVVLQ